MEKQIKTWNLLQVALLLLCTWSFMACSDDGDSTTGRQEYKYLFAAEKRDSTPEADRAQFAPYGWRNENPATEAMPQNFRTCQGPFVERDAKTGYDATYVPSRQGLDNLNISASSDFSEAGFTGLIAEIRKITSLPITIVDLRSESHGLINGTHVSLYGRQSWANIGLSTAEIIEKEHQQMHATLGTSIELVDISSSNDYVPVNPQTVFVERVQTEAELCKANGIDYVRFTALDHAFPGTAIVEDFVRFVQSLPANTWLHFHCKAGKGRTTTFMVFYDMMRNPDVPLKDIVYRQTNIGGEFPVYTGSDPDVKPWRVPLWEEKAEMIPLFYQYVQECHADGYTTTWGTWKQLLSS